MPQPQAGGGKAAPAAPAAAGEQAALAASYRVGSADLPLWPDGQAIEALSAPLMASTHFADHPRYHPELTAAILEMERSPAFRDWIFKGGCGMKVRRPDRWRHAAADLIHGRALAFAHRVLSQHDVYTDDCWASVYRDGQYCLPHSHLRSNVSIVYLLDEGDPDPDDPMAGQLVFADPRIPRCCQQEPGRVTSLLKPGMTPGTMIVFASDYVHAVGPYRGDRPRMTMSWNVTIERLPGNPADSFR
jgi:hypothetical protein